MTNNLLVHSIKSGTFNEQMQKFQPGIFDEIPNEVYQNAFGISRSDIANILTSPKYFLTKKEEPFEASTAMQFGTLVHDILMFPEAIKNYVFIPAGLNKRIKSDKDYYNNLVEEAEENDKIIIEALSTSSTHQPREKIDKILESVESNKIVKNIIYAHGVRYENSIFWKDEITCMPCKCRPDILVERENDIICGDIKTCQSASETDFRYSIKKYKYHLQASFYSAGIKTILKKPVVFVFIAIETNPPYDCALYTLDTDTLDMARDLQDLGLQIFKDCAEKQSFCGYEQKVKTIELKPWEI